MAKKKNRPGIVPAVAEAADGEETLATLAAVSADENGEEVATAVEAAEVIGASSVSEAAPVAPAKPVMKIREAQPNSGVGDTVIVKHAGQEHEAVCTGFAMGMKARLKDGKDTEVFVAHGEWRAKE